MEPDEARVRPTEAAIMGSLTFDKESNRLVKTYLKGLSQVQKEFLDLDPPQEVKAAVPANAN